MSFHYYRHPKKPPLFVSSFFGLGYWSFSHTTEVDNVTLLGFVPFTVEKERSDLGTVLLSATNYQLEVFWASFQCPLDILSVPITVTTLQFLSCHGPLPTNVLPSYQEPGKPTRKWSELCSLEQYRTEATWVWQSEAMRVPIMAHHEWKTWNTFVGLFRFQRVALWEQFHGPRPSVILWIWFLVALKCMRFLVPWKSKYFMTESWLVYSVHFCSFNIWDEWWGKVSCWGY